MKRLLVVVAVVALVLTLLPGFLGSPSPAIANVDTPEPLDGAVADAPLRYAEPLRAGEDVALVDALEAAAGPANVATHLYTGRARFIGSDVARPGFRGVATGIAGQPDAAARAFFAEYGPLFGVHDPASLRVMKQTVDTSLGSERTFVRYQQTVNGIPVLGGELVAQVDAAGTVWSASGEALPDKGAASLTTAPNISAAQAMETARGAVAKYQGVAADALQVSEAALWYYAPELLGRPGGATRLAWRMDVTPVDLLPIRELVLVDALTGKISLHFNQIPDAKTRTVYDNQNNRNAGLPGIGPVRTEGQGATGNADVDRAYDYAGDTYDFYKSRHNRDSIDGAGLPIISTVRYCPPNTSQGCPYENAFWNGAQMVYGAGYAAADDVVGHELTHGVTDYESQLFYYMQSGALNESMSDIWGEFIDLTNGKGTDGAGVRWLMGEDVPGGGAIRNMANPPAFNDPDRVGSSKYWCSLEDNGGVHINSGVPNKATYLMTDGGTFNGKTVTGLGLEKVVRIWYRVAVNTLVSGAEFQDVYDLLPQACMDMANAGAAGVTPADCQEVKDALDATQMNAQPASCASTEAPVCAAGENAQVVYSEDFENQGVTFGRWQSAAIQGPNPWYYPQTSNPYGLDDLFYATSGVWHLWGDDLTQVGDGVMEMKQAINIPATGKPYLRFRHSYDFEYDSSGYYDGGVMEYSKNGGAWTDAGSLFTTNGYDGAITSPFTPYNPLKGRQAFRANSWGYQSSRLDLASFKGGNVRFRFRVGADGDYAGWGWFIDDVRIYTCVTAPTPTPSPTPTRTPSPTPNTPWINWATTTLPPAARFPVLPARVLYGSVSSATNVTATITGGATFDDGTGSQTKPAAPTSGEVFFNVKAKAGATPGTNYTLTVKLGSVTITRTGKVGWNVKLPTLLK